MKTLSFVFILVGILWGLFNYWVQLVMTGMTSVMPLSSWPIGTLIRTALELMGPILLICGPAIVLSGFYRRLGSILTLLGCLVLTALVADMVREQFSMSSSDTKAFLPMLGALILIAILCDIGAIRLHQLCCR
jgi:hypothetical protein